jgi:hypothetical protein
MFHVLPRMKKVIVSSTKRRDVPKEFQPEWLANKLLLESEFKDGKVAYVKYTNGKLIIRVGSRRNQE